MSLNTKAVDKTGQDYFAGLSSVTLVGLRAFSRSSRDWSLGREGGMVGDRGKQTDHQLGVLLGVLDRATESISQRKPGGRMVRSDGCDVRHSGRQGRPKGRSSNKAGRFLGHMWGRVG
jgi:hypothetical protein